MHQEFLPVEALRDAIKCFWYDRRDFGPTGNGFEVTPDSYTEIIFHFGGSCSIFHNGEMQQLPSPFLVGLLNQPVTFYSKNVLEIVAIRCFPWTVFDLLDLPSDKKSVHVFDHPIGKLHSALATMVRGDNINGAIAELSNYFVKARANVPTNSTLFKAGVAMANANGTLTVSEVADAAHATVRTLERKFKQSSGHTVKDVSGLMRFEKVRNQLWMSPDSNLAGLAHEYGYADQSHLIKEFKKYSGVTPSAFVKNVSRRSHGSGK